MSQGIEKILEDRLRTTYGIYAVRLSEVIPQKPEKIHTMPPSADLMPLLQGVEGEIDKMSAVANHLDDAGIRALSNRAQALVNLRATVRGLLDEQVEALLGDNYTFEQRRALKEQYEAYIARDIVHTLFSDSIPGMSDQSRYHVPSPKEQMERQNQERTLVAVIADIRGEGQHKALLTLANSEAQFYQQARLRAGISVGHSVV